MRITKNVLCALLFLLKSCSIMNMYGDALNEREEPLKNSYENGGAYPDGTEQYDILMSCPIIKIMAPQKLAEPLKPTLKNIELYPKGTEEYNIHLAKHLLLAAAVGNIPVLEKLLASGVDINSANECGKTALMVAAEKGQLASVEWLIKHNANVTKRGSIKEDALAVAALRDNTEIASLLLDNGAEINPEIKDAFKPLAVALFVENPTMVNFLLTHGAEITDEMIKAINSRLSKDSSNDLKEIGKIVACHQKGRYYEQGACLFYPLEKTLRVLAALGTSLGAVSIPFVLLTLGKENPRLAAQFVAYYAAITLFLSRYQCDHYG